MSRFLYAWAPDEGDDAGKVAVDDDRGVIEFLTPAQADDLADSLKRAAKYALGIAAEANAERCVECAADGYDTLTTDRNPDGEPLCEGCAARRQEDRTPGSGDSSAGGTNSTTYQQ